MIKYLILLILSLVSFQSFSQISITGQVFSVSSHPVANANISIVGQVPTGITDANGIFVIVLQSTAKLGQIITLRVACDGYRTTSKHIAISYLSIPVRLPRDNNARKAKEASARGIMSSQRNANNQNNSNNQTLYQPATVTSYNQSGGVTANQVYLGKPIRDLNTAYGLQRQLLDSLPNKTEKITITCILNDKEAYDFANQIKDYLKSNSYVNVEDVHTAMIFPGNGGVLPAQSFRRNNIGANITIGANQ